MGRRSLRLAGFDYRSPGAYFVTVCTRGRAPLLSAAGPGGLALTPFGRVVMDAWRRTSEARPNVRRDVFVVMPDHVHGILWILDDEPDAPILPSRRGAACCALGPTGPGEGAACCAPTEEKGFGRGFGEVGAGSASAVVRGFKSAAARRINALRGTPGAAVWQRGFYERVVRGPGELRALRRYVRENPLAWEIENHHPFTLPRRIPSM